MKNTSTMCTISSQKGNGLLCESNSEGLFITAFEVGDKIFQYTDGVTEAINANNELYGMDRLTKILSANSALSPSELLPKIKFDIDEFVGEAPQLDDITMLCLEYRARMED